MFVKKKKENYQRIIYIRCSISYTKQISDDQWVV